MLARTLHVRAHAGDRAGPQSPDAVGSVRNRPSLSFLLNPFDVVCPASEHDANQRRIEAAEAQEWLAAIVSSSDDAIVGKRLDGTIVSWNTAAERMFGYAAGEIIGRSVLALIPPELQHEEPAIIARLSRGDRVEHFETERVRKDGSRLFVSLSVSPIRDATGKIVGAAKIARDITEQRRLLEQLQNQSIELEQQSEEAQSLAEELEQANEDLIGREVTAREALARFEGVFKSRVMGMTVFDAASGRTLAINDYLLDLIGYTREEFERGIVDWRDVTAPEYIAEEEIALRELVATGSARPFEKELVRKDGSRVPVAVSGAAIPELSGQFAVFVENITERRRVQTTTRFLAEASRVLSSSLDYETTLQSLADVVVPLLADWCAVDMLVDPTSKAWPPMVRRLAVVHEDPAKVDLARALEQRFPTDWSRTTGLPRVFRDGVSEFYPVITDDMLRLGARSEAELEALRTIQFSAGIIVPLIARGSVLGALTLVMSESKRHYDEADLALAKELAGRAAIAADHAHLFRAMKAARADAEAAAERAESASKAKSEFLATMSHEFRTPLNAIVGYVDLFNMEIAGPVTEQQREYLTRLAVSGEHLKGLINDILDMAKIDAGQLSVAGAVSFTGDAVRAAISLALPEAEARSLRIIDDLASGQGVPYVGDPDRVRQILVNLLSNAVKFTEPGGQVTVRTGTAAMAPRAIHGREAGPWAFVTVEDTGIGISSELHESVFEPFMQVESGTTRTRGGTGLGLTISRRLGRLMGGDVTVESAPGAGSSFTLWLATPARDPTVDT